MAIESQRRADDKPLHVEISESSRGPYGFDAMVEEIVDPSRLPDILRKRIRRRAVLIRVHRISLASDELPYEPFVWVVLFPRSRGQDLEVDLISGKKTFPVVAYGYRGAEAPTQKPLAAELMYDLGLGLVEVAD